MMRVELDWKMGICNISLELAMEKKTWVLVHAAEHAAA